MTPSPPAPAGVPDPAVWIKAQGELAADLATFQATSPTTTSHRLGAVLAAMQPAFKLGFAYSIQQTAQETTVRLIHRGGWDLQSTLPSDGLGEESIGMMLADLLGITIADAQQQQPVHSAATKPAKASAPAVQPVVAQPTAEPEAPDFADDVDEFQEADQAPVLTQPLSATDISTCLAMLKALPADARKSFTIAFRSHFQVPREERTISKFITDEQHKTFIQSFVDELELQEAAA